MNIFNVLGRRISQSRWIKSVLVIVVLVTINGVVATLILGREYNALKEDLRACSWPFNQGGRRITIEKDLRAAENASFFRV